SPLLPRVVCLRRAVSFFLLEVDLRDLHSFPTRRSSDLPQADAPPTAATGRTYPGADRSLRLPRLRRQRPGHGARPGQPRGAGLEDRKSTRLNSSHVKISYAVFCLKKKRRRVSPNTSDFQ